MLYAPFFLFFSGPAISCFGRSSQIRTEQPVRIKSSGNRAAGKQKRRLFGWVPVYKQATPTGFDEERPRVPLFLFLVLSLFVLTKASGATCQVLKQEEFKHHIELFNGMEDENWTNFISNVQSWAWLRENIPFFDCPDREVEEIYYFRWWSFRKHLVSTTDGFVITEFLVPMRHAGAFNTISCAAGHHLTEGRLLRDERYIDDYIQFWLRGNGGEPQPHFHRFSGWFAAAVWDCYLAGGDRKRIDE